MKLGNFLALDPNYSGRGLESHSKLDETIFKEYSQNLVELRNVAEGIKSITRTSDLSNYVSTVESDEEEDNAKEGKILYKMHKFR